MKTLKLDHAHAQLVAAGKQSATWRVNDDKDLHVNDVVQLIDKVNANDPASWVIIGEAKLTAVLEKQVGDIGTADMEGQEKFTTTDALVTLFQHYYGPQVNKETPVKIIQFQFISTVNPADKLTTNNSNSPQLIEVNMYADGGSRGNPGPSASGYVLLDMNNKIIVENGLYLGVTTNNQAEYQALKIGLEEAIKRNVKIIHVYMDSLLVINQMKGTFKVRNQDLLPINLSIRELLPKFETVSFQHVPRERNKLADAMVNVVLDANS